MHTFVATVYINTKEFTAQVCEYFLLKIGMDSLKSSILRKIPVLETLDLKYLETLKCHVTRFFMPLCDDMEILVVPS